MNRSTPHLHRLAREPRASWLLPALAMTLALVLLAPGLAMSQTPAPGTQPTLEGSPLAPGATPSANNARHPAEDTRPLGAPASQDDAWAEALLDEGKEEPKDEAKSEPMSYGTFSYLFLGAGIIAGLAWFFTKRQRSKHEEEGIHLKHLQSLRLGPKQHISMIQAGDRVFLLGVGQGSISLLSELDGLEENQEEPRRDWSAIFEAQLREEPHATGQLLSVDLSDAAPEAPAMIREASDEEEAAPKQKTYSALAKAAKRVSNPKAPAVARDQINLSEESKARDHRPRRKVNVKPHFKATKRRGASTGETAAVQARMASLRAQAATRKAS